MQILHYRLEIVEVGSASAVSPQKSVGLGGTFAFRATIEKPALTSELTSEGRNSSTGVLIDGSEFLKVSLLIDISLDDCHDT